MLAGMSSCVVATSARGVLTSAASRQRLLVLVLLVATAAADSNARHPGTSAHPQGEPDSIYASKRTNSQSAHAAAATAAGAARPGAALHAAAGALLAHAASGPNTQTPRPAQQDNTQLDKQQQEQQQQLHVSAQQRQVLQQQEQHQTLTPAQQAVAQWYERQRQQQQLLAAGLPIPPPPPPPPAGTPAAPGEFTIPVPPPGTDVPAETQMPLYSPDQLWVRHKLIPDVPMSSQIISLGEQMQQAEALGVSLSKEQLENANPLLGPLGPVQVPEKTHPSEYTDGYVAICAIVKNQHRDIREWLEYHRWLGVRKVYVYDNNSTVPLAGVISDLMQSGYVEYAFFMGQPRYRDLFRTSSQWWAYNDCVHRFRHRHRWLAFIDADEFIVLNEPQYNQASWQDMLMQQQQQQQQLEVERDGLQAPVSAGSSEAGGNGAASRSATHDINTFMQQYEAYGGLAVNWVIFGSSGHKSRPHGGVLVNYHACLPDQQEQNTHVKVIANTKYLMTMGDDPHRVLYNSTKHFTVNELGQQVTRARTASPSHTKIALYHYLTKSEEEYMQKMKRGSAAGNYKSPEFFYTINQFATDTCTAAIPLGLKCCPSVLRELGPTGVQQVQGRLAALQHTAAAAQHKHRQE